MVMSGKPGNGFPGEVRTLRLKPAVPVLAGDAETGVPPGLVHDRAEVWRRLRSVAAWADLRFYRSQAGSEFASTPV